MKRIVSVGIAFGLFLLFYSQAGLAQHTGHQHGGPPVKAEKRPEAQDQGEGRPNRIFLLDGFKLAFSIMPMAEHKKMLKDMNMKLAVDPQATHNIAVTISEVRSNLPIPDGVAKIKVISPKGNAQEKLLDFIMGMNQFSADFTLAEKGRHQILILFKTKGDKKAGGFYYLMN